MQEIRRLLANMDGEVRRSALEGLRGKPSEEAIPLLLRALEDKSWRVRKTASQILISDCPLQWYISGIFKLLYREEDVGARNSAIEILVKLGKKATPYLIKEFDTPNGDVRKFIIDIVGETKDRDALPLLLRSLKDSDDNVRASAVEHLGQLAGPEVVGELVEILKAGDVWVAFPAAEALGRIGDRSAIPALVDALSIRELREPVLKSLALFSAVETLEHIVPLLKDKAKSIQEETVKALAAFYRNGIPAEVISESISRVCGRDVLGILLSHARGKKITARKAAIVLLGLVQDEGSLDPLLDLSEEEELGEEVREALISMGRKRPECLIPLFESDNEYRRRFVTEAASVIASPLYHPIFERYLDDRDGHVRALAVAGLANIGEARSIERMQKLLLDPYEDVQEAAVKALSKLREGLQINVLIEDLKDGRPALRRNAALILGRISATDAVSALGFALKDEAVSVRGAVVEALSTIQCADSVRYLRFALTDENSDVRAAAALSLGSLNGEGIFESLSLLVSDSDDGVRAAAARSLGMLGDGRALTPLTGLLSDNNGFVVTAAMEALGRIGGEGAREALTGMLGSRDVEIRRTALHALSAFDGIEETVLPFLKDADWATRISAVEALCGKVSDRVRTEIEGLYDSEVDPAVKRVIEERFHVR
ncbi:MAG TPA: HEAT repeat domain-containing protein [Thermodesulfovibrionales bacterium]|nr:HEAT repeat domain-containing protein [Thermodesulfovibrionales bacterium]